MQYTWRGLSLFFKGLKELPPDLVPSVAEAAEAIEQDILPDGMTFINRATMDFYGDAERRRRRLRARHADSLESLGGSI